MNNIKKILIVLLLIALADSTYLTIVHYQPRALLCPKSGIVDCETVVTSGLSTIAGIPISIGGMVWSIVFLALVLLGKKGVLRNVWMILGLGAVLYSVTGMIILSKICIYCSVLDLVILLSVFVSFRYDK